MTTTTTNNNSLREEIFEYLWTPYSKHNYTNHPFLLKSDREDCYKMTDTIVSKIEKRIDNELHELEIRTYDLEDLGEDDATNETLIEYKIWRKVKEMLK